MTEASKQREQTRALKRKQEQQTIREYKSLLSEFRNINDLEGDIEEGSNFISRHIERSKFLYPKINKRTEAVALDALHTKKVAQLGSKLSTKIVIEQRPFEAGDFGKKLLRHLKKLDGRDIDAALVKFGNDLSTCFKIAPPFDYMYGTFNHQDLVKKPAREKRERTRAEAEPNSTIKAAEKDFETEITKDATPKEVEKIYKELTRTVRRTRVDQVDYFPLTVDPTSFSRTVENIFHSAFLAKEGKVIIKGEGKKDPKICPVKPSRQSVAGDNDAPRSEYHQTILSFNMNDWKAWIEHYNITSAALN